MTPHRTVALVLSAAFIPMAGCMTPLSLDDGDVDADDELGLEVDDYELTAPEQTFVAAPQFGLAARLFTIQGSGSNVVDVAPPPGFAKLYSLVELRGIQVGDKDMGFQLSSARSGGIERFQWMVTHAPAVSYGVDNLVTVRTSVLGLSASVEAVSGRPHRVINNATTSWPTTAFASGEARHWLALWSLETGQDDDMELYSETHSTAHSTRMWNGNQLSFADVQSVEIVPTATLRIVTIPFDVYSGTRRSYSVPRTPGRKFAVLAGADSYITCGADQFSFKIDCPESAAACTVRAWGGNTCSHVRGTIALLES